MKHLTLRSTLKFVSEHPGCTINDVLEACGLPLDTRLKDEEFFTITTEGQETL